MTATMHSTVVGALMLRFTEPDHCAALDTFLADVDLVEFMRSTSRLVSVFLDDPDAAEAIAEVPARQLAGCFIDLAAVLLKGRCGSAEQAVSTLGHMGLAIARREVDRG